MATKKITDLTLRSDFDETVNLPGDDTAQTWRVTGQQILDYIKDNFPPTTIQKFTSGSGTYTTPDGCRAIKVRLVGGGGGGAANSSTDGSDGDDTTFGTTLLSGEGGLHGRVGDYGGVGGAASLGSGPVGLAFSGSCGGPGVSQTEESQGGNGGCSPFGGNGGGGPGHGSNGQGGIPNTGSGGGGGGGPSSSACGSGGGSGGYVEAWIYTPSATYAYAVGAGGAGGSGGSSSQGGAGASGIIIVEEFY